MDLGTPVQFVKGIGPQRAEGLKEAGVGTVEDLLFHLPLRYEDRRAFAKIGELRPGMRASVAGEIVAAGLRRARRMSLYEIRIEDGTGRLKALWFNQPYLRESLVRGRRVVLFGTVERDAYASRQLMMASPEAERLEPEDEGVHTGRLVPVYEKLGPMSGKALRRVLARIALDLPESLPDPCPMTFGSASASCSAGEAFGRVHHPDEGASEGLLNAARDSGHLRLILEEFFLFQLGLAARQTALRGSRKGTAFEITAKTREAVKKVLPFPLTGAQKRVLREIADDMRASGP